MKIFKPANRRKIITALYPDICPYCKEAINHTEPGCENCRKSLPDINYHTYAKGGFPCISSVPYADNFARAVCNFKFHDFRQFDYQFALLMADTIKSEYADKEFDIISFVPMHKKGYKSRGYNQSELLAECLSELLKIPVMSTLIKTRNTKPQHKVKGPKRGENVKGAFRIANKELVKGKRILLIDDIITTGFTMGECAKTIAQHNPLEVCCATFAITLAKTDLK